MTKLFLDTETTGLELDHDIWEIAYAIEDGPIESTILPHSLKNADPKALDLNGYHTRFPGGARADSPLTDIYLREVFQDMTIVGANPAFDAIRLQLRWGCQPWHYRMIDISSMAIPVLGLRDDGKPMGLFDIAQAVRGFGHDVPEPDHTAAGDVATLRACYNALMWMAN